MSGHIIHDEVGREWLVLPGDPAWRWAQRGHHYLPAATIMSGEPPNVELIQAAAASVGDVLPYYQKMAVELQRLLA